MLDYDFQGKNVLELGAGTSMVSATIAKTSGNKTNTLYITDGDTTLLETLSRRNFHLNGLIDNEKFMFRRLLWNEDPIPPNIDIVLAADVTYDASVVADLCSCLLECLSNGRCKQCLISATIRNEDTIKAFEDQISQLKMTFKIVSSTEVDVNGALPTETLPTETLGTSLIAPIRIYSIEQ